MIERDDDDALLDSALKETWTCHYVSEDLKIRCKEDTKVVGHDCKYCKSRFCIKHRTPEVHNCDPRPIKLNRHGRVKKR